MELLGLLPPCLKNTKRQRLLQLGSTSSRPIGRMVECNKKHTQSKWVIVHRHLPRTALVRGGPRLMTLPYLGQVRTEEQKNGRTEMYIGLPPRTALVRGATAQYFAELGQGHLYIAIPPPRTALVRGGPRPMTSPFPVEVSTLGPPPCTALVRGTTAQRLASLERGHCTQPPSPHSARAGRHSLRPRCTWSRRKNTHMPMYIGPTPAQHSCGGSTAQYLAAAGRGHCT